MSSILIITGNENTGKSTLCKKVVIYARSNGVIVTGILSELVVNGEKKISINSIEIKTGKNITLADYSPGWDIQKPEKKWRFKSNVFEWGNHVLVNAIPTDLLVIDEIGYQELENQMGWNECFSILSSQKYKIGLLVIRPEFIQKAKQIWEPTAIFELKGIGQDLEIEQKIQKYLKLIKE
jgi:nucleoside-triphosphatase THEP1